MKYMLLICQDPSTFPTDPDAATATTARYFEFNKEIQESGEWIAGDRLHGVDSATSVRVNEGQLSVTDGPFIETKEHIGGYYIVDVADLDRAIELAGKLPAAERGVVEVRPIWEM